MAKLWMINQYASTPRQPGHTRHFDFAFELENLGFQSKVFASSLNLATRQSVRLFSESAKEEIIEGVTFFWIRSTQYRINDWRRFINMIDFAHMVYKAGRAQSTKPDIIIGSSPPLFASLAGYLLAKRLQVPFVLELRDLWPQTFIDMGHYSEANPLIRLFKILENHLYKNADHIIILAEGSRDYLEKKGVAQAKISYIPNGVRLESFQTSIVRQQARQKYNFSNFTIVYTGAHGPANGLGVILEAAKILIAERDLEFVLVGDGTLKKDLEKQAKNLNLSNLRFLPSIPKSEIPTLLLAADAAVITLTDAGVFSYAVSPNKLFDYMAAKKPVLCTVPGAVARMVEENNCGFISPPEDAEALADNARKIKSLSGDELAALGENGRDLIQNKYSRAELARTLGSLLSRLIQAPNNY